MKVYTGARYIIQQHHISPIGDNNSAKWRLHREMRNNAAKWLHVGRDTVDPVMPGRQRYWWRCDFLRDRISYIP